MMKTGILYVEGKDDWHVVVNLLSHHGVPELFDIKDIEGVDNLEEFLDVAIDGSGRDRIAIMVDADTDLHKRWRSIGRVLTRRGYHFPEAPATLGTLLYADGLPGVGVWVMPNNRLPGMLEDFVAFLVPVDDRLWDRAQIAVDSIPEADRKFNKGHHVKAAIHTWLAWQAQPGVPMGAAIARRYLDANVPEALEFIGWIRQVFPDGSGVAAS